MSSEFYEVRRIVGILASKVDEMPDTECCGDALNASCMSVAANEYMMSGQNFGNALWYVLVC